MVVATERAHAKEFTCCYHGWTYHLDGRLKAVPLNHGYPRDFEAEQSEDRDAAGAAREELSRLRVRERGRRRPGPEGACSAT